MWPFSLAVSPRSSTLTHSKTSPSFVCPTLTITCSSLCLRVLLCWRWGWGWLYGGSRELGLDYPSLFCWVMLRELVRPVKLKLLFDGMILLQCMILGLESSYFFRKDQNFFNAMAFLFFIFIHFLFIYVRNFTQVSICLPFDDIYFDMRLIQTISITNYLNPLKCCLLSKNYQIFDFWFPNLYFQLCLCSLFIDDDFQLYYFEFLWIVWWIFFTWC